MSKKIQLSILDPCHENWENMTPAKKGRFCAACQKQVIDFTTMGDAQLAAFFKKSKSALNEGSICGRFYEDQLGRSIDIPKKRIPWVKYFFQFTLPALLVSAKATAQGKVNASLLSSMKKPPACSSTSGPSPSLHWIEPVASIEVNYATKQEIVTWPLNDKPAAAIRSVCYPARYVSGIVTDEDGRPLPFASVMIKGTQKGMMADSMGGFRFEMPVADGEVVLDITSAGFEGKELLIGRDTDLTKEMVIRLGKKSLEGVTVISMGRTIRMGGAVSGVLINYEKDVSAIKTQADIPSMIKVYPNPVVSGTNINVGCQKLKEGYYYIQLANQAGQQVLNKQTWIDSEMQVLNIDIPHVATGVYFLKLTNKETNKRFTQKIIVE